MLHQWFEECTINWTKFACTKASEDIFGDESGKVYRVLDKNGNLIRAYGKSVSQHVQDNYMSSANIKVQEYKQAWAAAQGNQAGVCKPATEICPNIWAGTRGSYIQGQEEAMGNCKYDATGRNMDTRSGCCGGFQDMTQVPGGYYQLTQGGTFNEATGWWENGQPIDKWTSCWTGNGGIPKPEAALNVDNFGKHNSKKTYKAGQVIDISWVEEDNVIHY